MRILLADDHDLVRDAIGHFLTDEGVDTVVYAANVGDVLSAAQRGEVYDLVLLDYSMPGMEGLTGLSKVKTAMTETPVAILSGTASAKIAQDALAAGAAGFVSKSMSAQSMVNAIRMMAAGEIFVPVSFLQSEEDAGHAALTKRETQVLHGLCAGKSNKEIANDLDLQEVTIKLHVKTLCRKLEARNRTHAAMIARDQKLV